ncbi:hypothetical protein [Propionivibrio sp.]|uniref:hypothetical protein n=1 Tax=Propionivibrio sp. TaxID=2212460 RepID=UPI003BF2C38A
MKKSVFGKATAAQLRRMRETVPKFPGVPPDAGHCPPVHRYAFIIEEPRKFTIKGSEPAKEFDLKNALTQLLKTIDQGGSVDHSVFRLRIAEDDWEKLWNNRERRKKPCDRKNDPVNVTLRISRS